MILYTLFLRLLFFLVTSVVFFHSFHWQHEVVLFSFLTFCGGAVVVSFMYSKKFLENPYKTIAHVIWWSLAIEALCLIIFWGMSFADLLPKEPHWMILITTAGSMFSVFLWNRPKSEEYYHRRFPGRLTRRDRSIFLDGVRHFAKERSLTSNQLSEKTGLDPLHIDSILHANGKDIILSNDEIATFCLIFSRTPCEIYFYELDNVAYEAGRDRRFRNKTKKLWDKTIQIRNEISRRKPRITPSRKSDNLCCSDGPCCCAH